MGTTDWTIIIVVVAIIFLIIGYGLSFFIKLILVKKAEQKIQQAEQQVKRMINAAKADAKVEGAQILKEVYEEVDRKRNELIQSEEFYKLRDNNLRDREGLIEKKENDLIKRKDELIAKQNEYQTKIDSVVAHLETISGLSADQAKNILFEKIKEKTSGEANKFLKNWETDLKLSARQKAVDIISQAMERYSADIVTEKTSAIITLPNDDMKGRLIGKEGRNIKAFENVTGVDLIIDDTQGVVTISSFDPIRREIARRTIEKLVGDGRIQPARIEKVAEEEQKEVENIILEAGKQALEELNIYDMSLDEIHHIGLLKYRTSYGQNVLQHSIEVAKLAGTMAGELGLDVPLALRAGLLHDIGKGIDKEQEGSHVTLGVKLAKKWKENDVIINAIHSHHGEIKPNNPYSVLVSVADSLSAARPGARNNSLEDYITRLKEIEEICNKIPGVDKAYAMQAGRQVRVMVKPTEVDDAHAHLIAFDIKEKIKQHKSIPGDIVITVIRELRIQETVI